MAKKQFRITLTMVVEGDLQRSDLNSDCLVSPTLGELVPLIGFDTNGGILAAEHDLSDAGITIVRYDTDECHTEELFGDTAP